MQAAKLADQAGPVTRRAAAGAAVWAKPKVGRMRAWMAVRAARGSVSVQEDMAPRISAMLAATARRLDPPRPRTRRWPRVFAGTAVLTAGAAAAMAMSIRRRSRFAPPPMEQRQARSASDQRSTVVNSRSEAERTMTEPNGLSKTR